MGKLLAVYVSKPVEQLAKDRSFINALSKYIGVGGGGGSDPLKADKLNGATQVTDPTAYPNLGTIAGATQSAINAAMNAVVIAGAASKADKALGATQITDPTAYANIGSSANAVQSAINALINTKLGSTGVADATKADKVNGATQITDPTAYSNIATTAGTTQAGINASINFKFSAVLADVNGKVDRLDGSMQMTDPTNYPNIGSIAGVTQGVINDSINTRFGNINTTFTTKADKIGGSTQITDPTAYNSLATSANSTQSAINAAADNKVASLTTSLTGKVDKTTTVNGLALNTNITLTKANIGLGAVDNTSDAMKPVSTAQAASIALVQANLTAHTVAPNPHAGYQLRTERDAANGYAGLDANGKLLDRVLPDLAVAIFLGEVADENAMIALIGQEGDWCIRIDSGTIWIITNDQTSIPSNWRQMSYPGASVVSVNTKIGVVTLTKSDLGLSNVDNTADTAKPVSTATQTALNGKENLANKVTNLTTNNDITFPTTLAVNQALSLKVTKIGGTGQITDITAYPNIGTPADANQAQINTAIDAKMSNLTASAGSTAIDIHNATGSILTPGTIVKVDSYDIVTKVAEVSRARSTTLTNQVILVIKDDIVAGTVGKGYTQFVLTNIDTVGYSIYDKVYLGLNGNYIATVNPINTAIAVGTIIRAAVDGAIYFNLSSEESDFRDTYMNTANKRVFTNGVDFNNKVLSGLAWATAPADAVNKAQLDTAVQQSIANPYKVKGTYNATTGFVVEGAGAGNNPTVSIANESWLYEVIIGGSSNFIPGIVFLPGDRIKSVNGGAYIKDANPSLLPSNQVIEQVALPNLGTNAGDSQQNVNNSINAVIALKADQDDYDNLNAIVAGKQDRLTTGSAPQYFKGDLTLGSFTNDSIGVINTQKGINSGVAPLDATGKIPNTHLPALAITNTFVVGSQAAMLALVATVGDVAVRTDISDSFILSNTPATTLANWIKLLAPISDVVTVFGRIGNVVAEYGDYTTYMIPEATNNRYQSDNQKLFNDATAPIQGQFNSLTAQVNLKANLASPSFTGTPLAPTAAAGTNNTQIATTSFVVDGLATQVSKTGDTMTGSLVVQGDNSTFTKRDGTASLGVGRYGFRHLDNRGGLAFEIVTAVAQQSFGTPDSDTSFNVGYGGYGTQLWMRSERDGNGGTSRVNTVSNGTFKGFAFTQVSDSRLKTNVKLLDNCLGKINKLAPVEYDMRSDLSDDMYKAHSMGLIAEDLKKVFPEVISTVHDDPDQISYINYIALIPVLIKAVQELSEEVNQLKKRK